jgi:hypothetical protein
MVTGSTAAIVYGEPRLTNDVDVVVVLDAASIAALATAFPANEFYLPPSDEILREAAKPEGGHFNIIHHESGFKADVYPAGQDPLHAWALPRAKRIDVDGEPLMVAPPEYVILRKLEYFREGGSEKHLRDVRSILTHSADEISMVELESRIVALGLEDAWRNAKAWSTKP